MKYLFNLQLSKLSDLASEIVPQLIALEAINEDREVNLKYTIVTPFTESL